MEPTIKLHYNKFCGLARQPVFKDWLKSEDADLFHYLTGSNTPGCKARAERMMFVYNKLYEREKGKNFESFIKKTFPYVIDHTDAAKPILDPKSHIKTKRRVIPPPAKAAKAVNKHKVFKHYNPDILTFPQKRILVNDNRAQLEAQVAQFTADKFGVDTIIIENHAYIEFFDARYKSAVDKVSSEKRDIYQYKQKNK
jgi:hypothetical protein